MEKAFAKAVFMGSLVVAMAISGCSQKSDVDVDTQTSNNGNISTDNNTANPTNNTQNKSEVISNETSSRGNYGSDNSLYSVYFGFDRFIVEGTRNINTIKNNARLILESNSKVRIEGNTDEWGSDEYNYALALKRASSVKDALVNSGVSADNIDLVSYGESKPICLEKTRECWKENRRADFVLTPR